MKEVESSFDKQWNLKNDKIAKFHNAVAMIVVKGKEKGYFEYNFSDSFYVATGDYGGKQDFVKADLVKVFMKLINDFKKDLKDEARFEIEILDAKMKLTEASIRHAL